MQGEVQGQCQGSGARNVEWAMVNFREHDRQRMCTRRARDGRAGAQWAALGQLIAVSQTRPPRPPMRIASREGVCAGRVMGVLGNIRGRIDRAKNYRIWIYWLFGAQR